MDIRSYLIILCFLLLATAGALCFGYHTKVNQFDVLLEQAIRFQQACIASGPACTDRFENKAQAVQSKAK